MSIGSGTSESICAYIGACSGEGVGTGVGSGLSGIGEAMAQASVKMWTQACGISEGPTCDLS